MTMKTGRSRAPIDLALDTLYATPLTDESQPKRSRRERRGHGESLAVVLDRAGVRRKLPASR